MIGRKFEALYSLSFLETNDAAGQAGVRAGKIFKSRQVIPYLLSQIRPNVNHKLTQPRCTCYRRRHKGAL